MGKSEYSVEIGDVMKELLQYRVNLVERLAQAAHEFVLACEKIDPTRKLEGDWTLHQIATHVRDMDHIDNTRVRRTLAEENPLFESVDSEAWMREKYNKDEPIQNILNECKTNVDELCKTLNEIPSEAWSRTSQHETIGDGLTLQLWVEEDLAHIEEHLAELKKLA